MLAGPPRLVSLATLVFLFGLGWWYLRLVQSPASGSSTSGSGSGLSVDPRPPPATLKGGVPDFGVPLRFADPVLKPPGSNYSTVIVVPKTTKEDIRWMHTDLADFELAVYEVDNPDAKLKVPKNKGREAMVYLSYIIDHYDSLPDTVLFMHAHRHAWHNNILVGQDAVQMLKRLNLERVVRQGYMNVRCHHDPGCPDWIHLDRPGGDFDFFHKPEEIYFRRHIWEEVNPGAPVPSSLSGICCAQFAVSRERIRAVPLERFLHYRNWLLHTTMEDQFSGRIFEYIWHYIFTGRETHCPAMNTCYCDGYGFCFGGRQKFADYMAKMDQRNAYSEEVRAFQEEVEGAEKEGRTLEVGPEKKKRIQWLNAEVGRMDVEMETERDQALERGKDPAKRREETESWDSERIWEYAPKGD